MTPDQMKLVETFDVKSQEVETLLAGELTAETVEKAKALNSELVEIRASIENHQIGSELRDSIAAQRAWANTPTNRPAMPTGASVLGQAEAGSVVIENGQVQSQDGEGIYTDKELRLMRNPEYRNAFSSYLQNKGNFSMMNPGECRVLNEGTDTAGGFIVPEDFLNRLIEKKPTPTRVQDFVTQLNTSRDALTMPKVNYATDDLYTTGIRSTWTGEVPSSATVHRATEPVFGQIRIPVYTNMMSMPITRDLIEDAAFNVQNWAADKFRETIALLKDNMIINGTGVGQPRGILLDPNGTNEPDTVNSGSASILTSDGLVNLAWTVPEQYEDNLKFVFNKTNTGKAIAQLKDGNGRYTWGTLEQSGLVLSALNRPLLGYPVIFSGFMPNTTTNTYPIIFGDLTGYYLVNRVGFSIQVLNELYAETNQVLLLGRVRFGGAVAEDWKLKIQKVAA